MYFEFGPTREMSTPVIDLTNSGTLLTICNTSPVNLAAPTSPLPLDTIVIFFACDNGAATSAATYGTFQITLNKCGKKRNIKKNKGNKP